MSERSEDFQKQVDVINSDDPERAHCQEFALREEFIKLLATGDLADPAEIRQLAFILMQTEGITRWFA